MAQSHICHQQSALLCTLLVCNRWFYPMHFLKFDKPFMLLNETIASLFRPSLVLKAVLQPPTRHWICNPSLQYKYWFTAFSHVLALSQFIIMFKQRYWIFILFITPSTLSSVRYCRKDSFLANEDSISIWASTRENLSLGFLTKRDSNQSPQLQRLARKLKCHL